MTGFWMEGNWSEWERVNEHQLNDPAGFQVYLLTGLLEQEF